ncbi:hypothetical protein CRI83_04865 [Liquorilactobacillus nagelii]|nr:hypothetical protein [Liquorilactobacillus nagelii]
MIYYLCRDVVKGCYVMSCASQSTIKRFLIDFKKSLANGNWEIVQRREEYARLSMTPSAAKIILMELTPDDYVSGPENDRDRVGEFLWKFHKDGVLENDLYIKLKLIEDHAKVISFHETIYD